ncbi:MAG: hypothetical protein WC615_01620 [Mucilaginibacter sp.]|jgi:hypothetical protein|uniref:hypothetical protein n=1 Tax=Mucilaginibacter sp. TaxID=1882438 RepID=UPI003565832E
MSFKNYCKVFLRWLWLAVSFQKVHISALETDQELLYAGATCRLLWDIRGACMVKVYCNSIRIGTFLSAESPFIPLIPNEIIVIKAIGVYRNRMEELRPHVAALHYRHAPGAALTRPVVGQPDLIKSLRPTIRNAYPVSQHPMIRQPAIDIETTRMQQSEQELFTQLDQAQTETDNQTLITYYGNIVL